jgi:hypothetical protein
MDSRRSRTAPHLAASPSASSMPLAVCCRLGPCSPNPLASLQSLTGGSNTATTMPSRLVRTETAFWQPFQRTPSTQVTTASTRSWSCIISRNSTCSSTATPEQLWARYGQWKWGAGKERGGGGGVACSWGGSGCKLGRRGMRQLSSAAGTRGGGHSASVVGVLRRALGVVVPS